MRINTYNGELIHTSDYKSSLVNATKRDAIQMFKRYFRNLNEESLYIVNNTLYQEYTRPNQASEIIRTLTLNEETFDLSYANYRSIGRNQQLSTSAMNFSQFWNRLKQHKFHMCYKDNCKDSSSYLPLKPVLFHNSINIDALLNSNIMHNRDIIERNQMIIVPIESNGNWSCVFIHTIFQLIIYFDPLNLKTNKSAYMKHLSRSIKTYFDIDHLNWEFQLLQSDTCDVTTCENPNDTGIIIVAMILFYSQGCPLHYIKSDINNFRETYCFNLNCNYS